MKIGSKYQIRSDALNVIVSKKVTRQRKKTGEKYQDWQDLGYFSTTANALKFLLDHEVNETGFKDLRTVVKRIEQAEKMITQALTRVPVSHTERRKPGEQSTATEEGN